MLNSEEVIAAIHGSYATGSKNGFQNVLTLLDKMHVALRTPIVHVAGTNGKGSTCAMLESILRRAGYHTGLYTSPFLQAYQERIRLDGLPLDDARMVKYGNPLVQAAEEMRAEGAFVTPFEMGTALALAAFDGENCDIAIVEVGMGGRKDPTNIVHPILCAITAIGLDHMAYLGDTLEAIAGEKAGIIKDNTPVVCHPAEEGVRRVFAEAAEKHHAPLRQPQRRYDSLCRVRRAWGDGQLPPVAGVAGRAAESARRAPNRERHERAGDGGGTAPSGLDDSRSGGVRGACVNRVARAAGVVRAHSD